MVKITLFITIENLQRNYKCDIDSGPALDQTIIGKIKSHEASDGCSFDAETCQHSRRYAMQCWCTQESCYCANELDEQRKIPMLVL